MIRSLDESNNWQQSDIASPLRVILFHASFYIVAHKRIWLKSAFIGFKLITEGEHNSLVVPFT